MKQSHIIVEASFSPLPKGFLEELPRLFHKQGTTIYKKRNEIKLFRLDGQTVCVKKYGIPPLFNRFLYSVGLRMPKARHAYQNAAKISERGFNTPRQYGYVLVYKNGWLAESFAVGEFIENARSVESARREESVVHAFARYTAQLHARGMMHRDYILNNVLYTREGENYQFMLIDVNRFIFRDKPIRGFLQRMNLMQPFSAQPELKKFVQAYIQASSAPASLCWQVAYFRRWRTRYSQLKHVLKKIPGVHLFYRYRFK